jgi:hypothetical protein
MKRLRSTLQLITLSLVLFFAALTYVAPVAYAAACVAPSTDYGTVTSTVSIPTTGTYYIWSRMSAPDSASNSYMLEIDGNTCFTVAGNTNGIYSSSATTHFQTDSQNWTDTAQGGATVKMNFTATGNHTVKMIGTAANVYLDRLVMTTDATCTPEGTGDNCANPLDTTAPVASINSATPSTSTQGRVTVSASATDDNGTVTQVELFVDNDGTGTAAQSKVPAANGSVSFTVDNLSIGQHTFIIRATNAAGLKATSTATNATVADVTAPSAASITSPASNSTQSGTITVTGTGTDNVGITKIEFYADGALFGTDTAGPDFSATLDTTTLSNASHDLTVKVFDAVGKSLTSSARTITVNNGTGGTDATPPTITVPAPFDTNKAIIAGRSYQISVNVSDASGISKVIFQVDGVTKATRTTAPLNSFTLDTTTLTTGNHTIRVQATDNAPTPNISSYTSFTVKVTLLQDINRDCNVDFINDMNAVIAKLGQTSSIGTVDINGDGQVDFINDINGVISKLGQAPCAP